MKASILIRTGSSPVQSSPIHGSPKVSFSYHDSVTGILFSCNKKLRSTRSSLHLEIKGKKDVSRISTIRRSYSETNMSMHTDRIGSQSFPTRIPEEEDEDIHDGDGGAGDVVLIRMKKNSDRVISNGRIGGTNWPANEVEPEDHLEVSGGGTRKGRKVGGGKDGGGGRDDDSSGDHRNKKIGAYYEEMLMANPGNPLLLRNYGKLLHEVERDVVRAEEYYERAILASPGDGEVLSLYGKLIWEAHRDVSRAKTYFDQAIQASPDDCFILGSYAQFLWDAEEDEDERGVVINKAEMTTISTSALVEAF